MSTSYTTASVGLRKSLLETSVAFVFLTAVTGLLYPALTTGIAQTMMRDQASRSLVFHDGRVVGSSLIGQDWTKTPFFQTRPSAVAYDGASSGASNLGPTNPNNYAASNPALVERVEADIEAFLAANPNVTREEIPADLMTASGSGLDPHISRAAALYQVPVVARRTGLSEAALTALIEEHDESGLFGRHHYVNVLNLNIGVQSLLRKAS